MQVVDLTDVFSGSISNSNNNCVIIIIIIIIIVVVVVSRTGLGHRRRLQSGGRRQALLSPTAAVRLHRSTRHRPRRHLLMYVYLIV